MEKSLDYSKYRNGFLVPLLIGVVIFFILYFYSRITSPDQEVFLSKSLYSLAVIVLASFLACLGLFFVSIHRFYFLTSAFEKDPNSLLYQLQYALSLKKYKLIFLGSFTAYFIFFGFLSNIFIYFVDENTIFSFIPLSDLAHKSAADEQGGRTEDEALNSSIGEADLNALNVHREQHNDHQDSLLLNPGQNLTVPRATATNTFPDYQLIICCNYIGYVPMLILKISENFSVLIIPLNLLIASALSVLVGLNISLNIYLLSIKKSIKLSKKNYFGAIGISTGLFVGCPTCTGSLFYSLVGFSSLVIFTSLNFYQILFVSISIPMLFISLWLMMKMLQKSFIDSCKLQKNR